MMHQPIAKPAKGTALLQGVERDDRPRDPALVALAALAAHDQAFPFAEPEEGEVRNQWHARWSDLFTEVARTDATTVAGVLGRLTVAADTEGTERGIELLRSSITNLEALQSIRSVTLPMETAEEMVHQGFVAKEIGELARVALDTADDAADWSRKAGINPTEYQWNVVVTLLRSIERAATEIKEAAREFDVSVEDGLQRRVTAG